MTPKELVARLEKMPKFCSGCNSLPNMVPKSRHCCCPDCKHEFFNAFEIIFFARQVVEWQENVINQIKHTNPDYNIIEKEKVLNILSDKMNGDVGGGCAVATTSQKPTDETLARQKSREGIIEAFKSETVGYTHVCPRCNSAIAGMVQKQAIHGLMKVLKEKKT